MKNNKLKLLTAFIVLPGLVFAHGEEVLVPLFMGAVSVIAFLIFIWIVKIKAVTKLIITAVYCLVSLIMLSIINSLPFFKNMHLINVLTLIPIVIVGIMYLTVHIFKKDQPTKQV